LISSLDRIKTTSIDADLYILDNIEFQENDFESSESFFPLGFNGIYDYKLFGYSRINSE
jgi:hypothetical protein